MKIKGIKTAVGEANHSIAGAWGIVIDTRDEDEWEVCATEYGSDNDYCIRPSGVIEILRSHRVHGKQHTTMREVRAIVDRVAAYMANGYTLLDAATLAREVVANA